MSEGFVDLDKYDVGFLLSVFDTLKHTIEYDLLDDDFKRSFRKCEKAVEDTKKF